MPFWMKNAAIIVNANGNPIMCPVCPCGTVTVDCCENPLPETLTMTVIDKTGDCTCLPDSVTLQAVSENSWSANGGGSCESPDIVLTCNGTTCDGFELSAPICGLSSVTPDDCSCEPFQLVFTDVDFSGGGCCSGTATLIITE